MLQDTKKKVPWYKLDPELASRLKHMDKMVTGSDKPKTEKPQMSFMWELEVRDRMDYGETVGFYAKTTSLPVSITEPVKHYICGTEYQYAGRDVSPRVFRVTLFDNELLQVWGFFDYWRMLTNEGIAKRKLLPKHYFRDVILRLKTEKDEDSIVFIFKDCYPLEIGEMALSYSDSGEATFDVLLSFQGREMKGGRWWKPTWTPTWNGKVIM